MHQRKISITSLVFLVLGVALGGSGIFWWTGRSGQPRDSQRTTAKDERAGDAHSELGEKPDSGRVALTPAAQREAGIEVMAASGGELDQTLVLPAEIQLNADRVAHIVPRVAGIVKRVDKNVSDEVMLGEVMAVLESRELAEAKAAYMAALERLSLARATFKSSEDLKAKNILPELEFLATRKQLAETEIDQRIAENKLHALGLTHEQIAAVPQENGSFAIYELRAPFSGTVIQKHLTLGESVNADSEVFMLADLSSVWVNIAVYGQDIVRVHSGQTVRIEGDGVEGDAVGKLSFVSPVIDEPTRTAMTRFVLENPHMKWKPGMFVRATIKVAAEPVELLLPAEAVQTLDGKPAVYVEKDGVFDPRSVVVGRKNMTNVEIVSGIKPGERVVVKNAFLVKSQGMKSELGEE